MNRGECGSRAACGKQDTAVPVPMPSNVVPEGPLFPRGGPCRPAGWAQGIMIWGAVVCRLPGNMMLRCELTEDRNLSKGASSALVGPEGALDFP